MEKYLLADLQIIANDIRQDIIRMLKTSGSGHAGGSLGMADIFTALYFNILDHDPKNPDSNKKDKLILSAGHICPVLYASLARAGYFPLAKLKTLRKLNSSLQGHPHNLSLAGVEVSAGPLGQGISQAVGFALAAQMDKSKAQIFCVTSDGEHNEGQNWEAIMTAAKYRLGNLINIIDYNGIQIDGKTNDIMPLGNLKKKYESFGWASIGSQWPQNVRNYQDFKKSCILPKISSRRHCSHCFRQRCFFYGKPIHLAWQSTKCSRGY
jgi:transketolase